MFTDHLSFYAQDDVTKNVLERLKLTAKKLPGLHYGGLPPAKEEKPVEGQTQNSPKPAEKKALDMFDDDFLILAKQAAAHRVHLNFLLY